MKKHPRYLMDNKGFYWNRECPELNLSHSESNAKDIKKIRIPVRIFRKGKLVRPGTNLPPDIASSTLQLAD